MLARAYAHVLGVKQSRAPNGLPIMLSSQLFDDEAMTPREAIAHHTAKWSGHMPDTASWSILAVYAVKPQYIERDQIPYQRVYVLEHIGERAMRAHLGIDDSKLDPFALHGCWYLERIVN
jgi:hypothetical protein